MVIEFNLLLDISLRQLLLRLISKYNVSSISQFKVHEIQLDNNIV